MQRPVVPGFLEVLLFPVLVLVLDLEDHVGYAFLAGHDVVEVLDVHLMLLEELYRLGQGTGLVVTRSSEG